MTKNLNIYEWLFFYLFTSTTRTNKSIPAWSTTIFLSVVTALYILAFGILSPFDMKIIGRHGFMFFMFVSIAVHWFYFLKNNRILNKFERIKPRSSLTGKILTGLYSFGGFATVFYSLEIDWIYTLFIAVLFGVLVLSAHWFGTDPRKFE